MNRLVRVSGHVLIVDDDPVIQLLLRVNFEMDGFEVTVAGDGQSGLDRAIEMQPDLILLDVVMPGLGGLEVLRALRARSDMNTTPIVLLSAKTKEEDRREGFEAGASAYITKPFNPMELLKEVKGIMAATTE